MANYIDIKSARELLPERPKNSHKFTFGKILNVAGCAQYTGAAFFSSVSPLRVGAGYVALASVKEVVRTVVSLCPEIVCLQLSANEKGCISEENSLVNIDSYDVVSIGCGISTDNSVKSFFLKLISNFNSTQKIVIDADGINILSTLSNFVLPSSTIITPHTKELSRLLNVCVDEIDENREKYARLTAQKYDCIVVLKGHNTIICDAEQMFINKTGSSALAKAGSGDVLTGIISGLLAQRVSPFNAAVLGVYLHGLAGDIAASDLTQYCVLASDVVDYIPVAINTILNLE